MLIELYLVVLLVKQKAAHNNSIDPGTSRMRGGRSTI